MNDELLPEPLENFLQTPPSLPAAEDVREAIFERTTRQLPQPLWRRGMHIVAGLAAAVALTVGAYVISRLGNGDSPRKSDIVERKKDPEEKKSPPPLADQKKPADASRPANPLDLEWTAFDAADDRQKVRLYFQAGDLYLDGYKDYESAARCYNQALHFAEARERKVNVNDNWLVIALKRDYGKEY